MAYKPEGVCGILRATHAPASSDAAVHVSLTKIEEEMQERDLRP
jgi:hypothetical protein